MFGSHLGYRRCIDGPGDMIEDRQRIGDHATWIAYRETYPLFAWIDTENTHD
jgi:hypothetical protein